MLSLLTCTDGSVYAESTYQHAAWVIGQTGGSIQLLHILEKPRGLQTDFDFSGNLGLDTGDDLLQEVVALEAQTMKVSRERSKRILARGKDFLQAQGVAEVSLEQRHGSLVESLGELEKRADLVVLGKRGEATDFAKLHLGSNLERVIRASERPVLVASRAFQPIERCVIAYDGGKSIEKAIEFLIKNPLLKGVEVLLLRAEKPDEKGRWFLGEAAEKLTRAGLQVETVVSDRNAEEAIASTVESRKAQLLIMGAYGHSRIRHLIIGSTTTTLIRTCTVPVLLFR